MNFSRSGSLAVLTLGALSLLAIPARAGDDFSSGVSDDRLSLPEGPGSLEGVGENVDIDPNMALMSWRIPIQVPQGFGGLTPSLALAYSSGNGASLTGMGWSISLPSIERMTMRGLPVYDLSDGFVVGGGTELVRVSAGDSAVTTGTIYRSRFEKDFTRYLWHDQSSNGAGGYWEAQYSDGSVAFFGASSDGTAVSEARAMGAGGVFTYHMVEKVDVHGHRLVYDYTTDSGGVSLISGIRYVFKQDGSARFSLTFDYESREDYIPNCQPGVCLNTTQRMHRVSVFSGAERLRQYIFTYDDYDNANGLSRIINVKTLGLNNNPYPVEQHFTYTRALGAQCTTQDCGQPYLVEMGSLGVSLNAGKATLIDMNGDALPDVVDTTDDGPHKIFYNNLTSDGLNSFSETPSSSAIGRGDGFRLDGGKVQTLDSNGDGFTDLVNGLTGTILLNTGTGDWDSSIAMSAQNGFPAMGQDPELRFFDYDNDKKIDMIRSDPSSTTVWRNTGSGFVEDTGVDTIGAGFTSDNLQFADMNGDGLLDVVKVIQSQVSYRLNHGWGHFSDWVNITGLPIDEAEVDTVMLDDINGDAMADLVVVSGNQVKYALNRKGDGYDPAQSISTALGGTIPERTADFTVLTADMNGNGSNDIVWISGTGQVTYLELFPVRPNLLAKIENSIGRVTDVTYTTSVEEMARAKEAGDPWQYRVPYPMNVVKTVDEWDTLSNLHNLTQYNYRDGFYDGVEKQYRGYETVEIVAEGDQYAESSLTVNFYDVGKTDPYHSGLMLKQYIESDGRPISETISVWGDDSDCAVAEVPSPSELQAMGRYPVRWVCKTGILNTIKEGQNQTDWVHTEEHWSYDGYGNKTLHAELGVTSIGAGGCAPCTAETPDGHYCGDQCLGDEHYTEKSFVPTSATGGRWITGAMSEMKKYDTPDSSEFLREQTFYDGDDFVGLSLGHLTKGLVSRTMTRVDANHEVATRRYAYNDDGMVIAELDPLGSPDGDDHRRDYSFDDDGLNIVSVDVRLTTRDGTPYSMRREVTYDPTFSKPIEATAWIRYQNGTAETGRNSTYYSYDDFGRLTSTTKPGDNIDSPTEVFEYHLADPVSSYVTKTRSQSGGSLDLEHVTCYDGRGRQIQERNKISTGRYLVTGFMTYNKQGKKLRTYQPYEADSPSCDTQPPSGLGYAENRYDAMDRLVATTRNDATIFGSNSHSETHYFPTYQEAWDENDLDDSSPYYQTPIVQKIDGRGRILSVERQIEAGGSFAKIQFTYDALGHMQGYIDDAGHEKVQQYDGLSRMVRSEDPDRGVISYTYDDASNLTKMTDARGRTIISAFDGDNRAIERWEEGNRDATLIEAVYDKAPSECPADQCTNPQGKIAVVRYPGGDLRHGYDSRNREILTSRTQMGQALTTKTTFDNANRVISRTYPDDRTLNTTYDAMGRINAVQGFVDAVHYSSQGPVDSVSLHNGDQFSYSFDQLLQLTNLKISNGDSDLQDLNYTYDRTSNILEVIDNTTRSDDRFNASAQYQYDAWYRLVEASLSANGTHPETLSFDYDSIDRLLEVVSSQNDSARSKMGTRSYDSTHPHAVTQVGDLQMQYDAAGYLTQQGDLDLHWDAMGRLDQAGHGDDTLATYSYGHDQTRISKRDSEGLTLYPAGDFEIRDGISSVYVRFDGKRVARVDDDSLQTQLYTDVAPLNAPDNQINAGDAWVAFAKGEGFVDTQADTSDSDDLLFAATRRLLFENSDDTHYLHHDHLGSVTQMSDSSGAVVGERSYFPFGDTRAQKGELDRYGFTGQERDAVTGFVHMGHRYLDTGLGAWTSTDPGFTNFMQKNAQASGIDEATSAYSYASNNPVTRTDPTGLKSNKKKGPSKTETQPKHELDSGVKGLKKKAKKSIWKRAALMVGTALIGAAIVVGVAALTAATGGAAAAAIAAIPLALGGMAPTALSTAFGTYSANKTINKAAQSMQNSKSALSTTYKADAPSQKEIELFKFDPNYEAEYRETKIQHQQNIGAMTERMANFGLTKADFFNALGNVASGIGTAHKIQTGQLAL